MFSSIFDPRRLQPKKLRLLLAWTGGILLIFNTRIDAQSFRLGIPVVLLGELIRILASGYLEKKGQKLASSGPFAFVRNPLYIGNFTLGLGFVLMSNNVLNVILFAIGFVLIYMGTVKKEEKVLGEMFGAAYADYCREVPRFFPKLKPYAKSSREPFQWSSVIKHREYITVAGIMMLIPGCYVWEKLRIDGQLENTPALYICGFFVVTGLAILLYDLIRRETEKRSKKS